MKCPCCSKEMTKGFVQSARRIFFTEVRNDSWLDISGKDDVVLSTHNWTNPTCIAYHCEDCKKVVIDYSDEANKY